MLVLWSFPKIVVGLRPCTPRVSVKPHEAAPTACCWLDAALGVWKHHLESLTNAVEGSIRLKLRTSESKLFTISPTPFRVIITLLTTYLLSLLGLRQSSCFGPFFALNTLNPQLRFWVLWLLGFRLFGPRQVFCPLCGLAQRSSTV